MSKVPDFNALPDLSTLHQDTRIFPAFWVLIGRFKFPALQPYARKDCWLQAWYYMKNVSIHQHDKNRYSRIATVDSCFVLFGTRQHCVAKICNASQTASAHKLQNDPFTISSSVLRTHLRPETRVATSRVPGRKETKCQFWCLERRKINVAGQSQPKHSNAWPVPCFKNTAYRIWEDLRSKKFKKLLLIYEFFGP